MRIEWPRNSGRVADYDEYEMAMVRELLHSGKRGVHLEIEVIHAFKVEFPDARFVPPSDWPDTIAGQPFPSVTDGTPTLEET